jgi:hypothetical protein
MKHRIILVIHCLLGVLTLPAQQHHRCGEERQMQKMQDLQPGLIEDINRTLAPGMAEKRFAQRSKLAANTLYIPVHVIVVHKPAHGVGQASNLSKARILSQLTVLNKDFSRTNADTVLTPAVFSKGNPSIQFCMATLDPDGNATDGITRYPSTANFDDEEFAIKGETGWPRTDYLNIWVAEIEDLGYAYIPSLNGLPNSTLDGVVINTEAFGGPGSGTVEPYDLGRTATHEIGHFLGLQHIWRSDGCNSDDGFSDTPLQDVENYGCPVHPSPSCNNAGDMFMNYMDYTDDACMNAFSAMQANHMRTILMGIRASLAASGETQCNAAALAVTIDSLRHPACFGEATGYAAFGAMGGTAPYTFQVRTETNVSGEFSLLASGQYTLIARDAAGDSVLVDFAINTPALLLIDSLIIGQPVCAGDSGVVTTYVSGGTPFNNQGYNISVNGNPTGATAQGLTPGVYTVLVADSLGCTAQKAFTINEGQAIDLNLTTVSGIRCHGDSTGTIFVAASGGYAPIAVTVNQKPVTTAVVSSLKAGFYSFMAVDAKGCTTTDTVTLKEPDLLVAAASNSTLLCFNDKDATISFTASGGRPPYFYSIDGQHFSTSANYADLGAGTYPLIVLDSDQCRWQDTLTIDSPDAIVIDTEVDYNATLDQYQAVVHITGGQAPYMIQADSSLAISEDTIFTGEVAGSYIFTVVDSLGCEVQKTVVFSATSEPGINEFSIGPNPVKDYLVIRYSGNKNEEANLKIYDISGKLLWEQNQILFSPEKNIHNIFVSNVPNSIFIFKIALKFKSSHILIFKE